MDLIVATRNAHKLAEIQTILGTEVRCFGLDGMVEAPTTVESSDSFAGNAVLKATAVAHWWSHQDPHSRPNLNAPFVLADDSGIEVDALGGAPGVHSARFATGDLGLAGNSPDEANNCKLLESLRPVPAPKRSARFRCVLALMGGPAGNPAAAAPLIFEGVCEGHIAFDARGNGGFGYDPLFIPTGHAVSFAELGAAAKNAISHRAKALQALRTWFDRSRSHSPNASPQG
jgi:XTP/dITP diphosphohydrolase